MKGFFIEVTNNLIDPKHYKAIGPAVWEFMWCLDKVTLIDEDGIGWVWGRKPVVLPDIVSEIGGSVRSSKRNMARLEKAGYIIRIRTPRGMQIGVAKAKKRFGRKPSDVPNVVQGSAKSGTSNIRQYKDSKQRRKTSSTFSRLLGKGSPRSMEYVGVDDDGNEVSPRRKKGEAKPEGQNKVANRVRAAFVKMCEKEIGIKPVLDIKGYKMVLFALNKGGLTEAQVMDLFDEWFKLGKPDEEAIAITRALSARQIEAYKVRNNVK